MIFLCSRAYAEEDWNELEIVHAMGERIHKLVHEDVLLLKAAAQG